ncbi:LysE family translocator [Celerinatantimonas yamalensis]|uniref:LysE family translocator n=1 Tax=Celerinatantimonas yamalensis TaxID=559956 RepID=A0ABW9G2P6_9GAMM
MNTSMIFLSIATIWGMAVVTPGANFFITVKYAIIKSRINLLFCIIGICSGTLFWASFGAYGLVNIFSSWPITYVVIKYIGGGYLIYLGIKSIISTSINNDDIKLTQENNWFDNYLNGLFTNISNPKTPIFIASIFAVSFPKSMPSMFLVYIILEMVIISFAWYSLVGLFFSSRRSKLIFRHFNNHIKIISGIIFILFGLGVIIVEA